MGKTLETLLANTANVAGKKERWFGPIDELHQRRTFTLLSYGFLLPICQQSLSLSSFVDRVQPLRRHSFRVCVANRFATKKNDKSRERIRTSQLDISLNASLYLKFQAF